MLPIFSYSSQKNYTTSVKQLPYCLEKQMQLPYCLEKQIKQLPYCLEKQIKQLPYCLEKQTLVYVYKNRFLDIVPWPNFFSQGFCTLFRSNSVFSFEQMTFHPPLLNPGISSCLYAEFTDISPPRHGSPLLLCA